MVDNDMVVIGSGRRAAVQFAKRSRSVLVTERGQRLDGVQAHTGIIRSKPLRETAGLDAGNRMTR